jgi:hypothetical protein
VRSIFSPRRIDFDCSEADEDANECMRYSRSIGHNPVLIGVLESLDCQASFCLFVDFVKVFESSDVSRADDISA